MRLDLKVQQQYAVWSSEDGFSLLLSLFVYWVAVTELKLSYHKCKTIYYLLCIRI